MVNRNNGHPELGVQQDHGKQEQWTPRVGGACASANHVLNETCVVSQY
jgi:hypothetical protein